jgi:GTPase
MMQTAESLTMLGHVSVVRLYKGVISVVSNLLVCMCIAACNLVLSYSPPAASSAPDICAIADKVLTFIDMGGHQRCLKTAL